MLCSACIRAAQALLMAAGQIIEDCGKKGCLQVWPRGSSVICLASKAALDMVQPLCRQYRCLWHR